MCIRDRSLNGKELASHADIEDKSQTVTITKPTLSTTAVDGLDAEMCIRDSVQAVVTKGAGIGGKGGGGISLSGEAKDRMAASKPVSYTHQMCIRDSIYSGLRTISLSDWVSQNGRGWVVCGYPWDWR